MAGLGESDVRPVDFAELAGIAKKPVEPVVKHVKQFAAAVKLPEIYTVETVVNGKITVTKFPEKLE